MLTVVNPSEDRKHATYLSNVAQNEMIESLGEEVRSTLVADTQTYNLKVLRHHDQDSTPDVSRIDQHYPSSSVMSGTKGISRNHSLVSSKSLERMLHLLQARCHKFSPSKVLTLWRLCAAELSATTMLPRRPDGEVVCGHVYLE